MGGPEIPASLEALIPYGYAIMFLVMLLEGPAITMAAAFAASLGYFNIVTVFVLSYFGDWITDIFYYAVGMWGRRAILSKYAVRWGVSEARIQRIETLLRTHSVKGLVIIKLIPFVPTLGLITAGAIRMPFKKFVATVSVVITGTTITYTLIGFFFGNAYREIARAIDGAGIAIILLMVALGALYAAYRGLRSLMARIAARITEKKDL